MAKKVNEVPAGKAAPTSVKDNPADARVQAEARIHRAQGALRLVGQTARGNWALSDAQREQMAQAVLETAEQTAAALRKQGTSKPTFKLG